MCAEEKRKWMRAGLMGVLGMRDPLDWDPDPQAESTEPSVSTSHKSTRLCRIAKREFIFSSFVFSFLSVRTGFLLL